MCLSHKMLFISYIWSLLVSTNNTSFSVPRYHLHSVERCQFFILQTYPNTKGQANLQLLDLLLLFFHLNVGWPNYTRVQSSTCSSYFSSRENDFQVHDKEWIRINARRLMTGSVAPTCTCNECRGCKFRGFMQQQSGKKVHTNLLVQEGWITWAINPSAAGMLGLSL